MNEKFLKLHVNVNARIKNYEWYEKENMIYKLRRQIKRYFVTAFLIHYCFAIGFYFFFSRAQCFSTFYG